LKASRKREHGVSSNELLELPIQMMPALLRLLLVTAGCTLIGFAATRCLLRGRRAGNDHQL
jgi:hypothetical protein